MREYLIGGKDQQCRNAHDRKIKAGFFIPQEQGESAFSGQVKQVEVRAGQDHEDQDDDPDIRTVKMSDTVVVIGKSAGPDGAETVDERIVKAHAAEFEEQHFREREAQIEQVEAAGGVRKMRGQLVLRRAGGFRVGRDLSADAEHREQRHHENDDPHAAQPVGKGAPEQDRSGQDFDIGKDRGAGRTEAGAGLEERIRGGRDRTGQPERKRADHGTQQPADRHDKKTVPDFHFYPGWFAELSDDEPDQQAYREDRGKRLHGTVFLVSDRQKKRRQHRNGQDQEQRALDPDQILKSTVHGRPFFWGIGLALAQKSAFYGHQLF